MNTEKKVTANREYKSTIFSMLFKDKEKLLSLYNAPNNSHYTDVDELETVTLENVIYMTMKNDLAFILDCKLSLYEHQSTSNPNMPLRDLFYVSKEYEKLINKSTLYSRRKHMIPTPRFVVFYNGVEIIVTECIKEGILEEFLRENQAEVVAMSIFEFDEEKEWKLIREDEYSMD